MSDPTRVPVKLTEERGLIYFAAWHTLRGGWKW